jgi:predicted TIM-barrel fold metal-dependent hydrolase
VTDLPIVDAHQHFWDPARNPYPWLTTAPLADFRYGDYTPIKRRYLPEDYRRDAASHRVLATVHMEAEWDTADEVAETRWLAGLRRAHGLPTVAVGHARLEIAGVAEVLAGHARFDFVRGVRQKPAPGQMLDPVWRRGYALLERHRLSYDLQAPFAQLHEAADLARAFPRTQIIVNHTGLPVDRGEEGLRAWRRALETLAAEPNVAIKISGLGARDRTWPAGSNRRVVRETIAVFGVARCMFASNFPVDGLCASYDTIVAGFQAFVADLPLADRRALFHDNAVRYYRLDSLQ